MILDEFVLYY